MFGIWKSKQVKQKEHFDAGDVHLRALIEELDRTREQTDKTIERYRGFVADHSDQRLNRQS